MRILAAMVVVLAGCPPICPESAMDVVSGPDDGLVRAGDVLQLRARYGSDVIGGPGACDGYWYVNGVLGGSAALGTIDPCGLYRVAALPDNLQLIRIEATEWDLTGGCADCCAYASLLLEPVR